MAVAAASALFAAGCGIGGDTKEEGLGAGDYTVTSVGDVTNSVVVNGHISPVRSMSITSPVQSKVQRLAVAVGDRVEAGQFLAEMDTEALEREIANQQRQQAAAQAEAMQGYEQAQAQLAAHTQQVRNGTHPAISAARAQVAQAQAEVAAANGQAPQDGTQGADRAPVEMVLASNERGQTVGIAPVEAGEAPSQGQAQGQAPQQTEGQAPEQAYSDLQAANGQLQAAQAQAAQESQQLQAQAEGAWQQAQSAGSAGTDGSLEYQVQQSTIYAPIGGVISSVDVQEGDVPQGRILTIADDSRLLIRSEVREADVPNIKAGDRVKFTSTATGSKEYTGKVGRIAPVGSAGGQQNPQQGAGAAGASAGGSGSVTFPIEIEVEGDKEGLLLGGTVRAEIITAEEPGALSVPRDAVYDGTKVLVLATGEGEDAKQGTVEERTVTTGAANEVDIAVTGGDLKPGDIVINWPDEYRGRLGETVGINDPKFDPAQVDKAREGAKNTPAGTPENTPAPAAEQNQ